MLFTPAVSAFFALSLSCAHFVVALPSALDGSISLKSKSNLAAAGSCFPALGFKMPSSTPSSLTNWWCNATDEYAFLGFSYEVTACQSQSQLNTEFADIRKNFNGRYVRLYGFCDNVGFYDDVIEAAWTNGLGVHALIWFGFDGTDQWKGRRDTLFATLHSNPKAKFVTRVVQFGSEPLYDYVLTPAQLTTQVKAAKKNLTSLGIPVTVSELAYGYQEQGGAQDVLDAIDSINIHMLPFFDQNASTSDQAWSIVVDNNLNFFITNGGGKKMYFDENGWPSTTYPGVEPNSPNAVADVPNEAICLMYIPHAATVVLIVPFLKGYYTLLEEHCTDLKNNVQGGVGWFAHIYNDDQEPGYGIYDTNGNLKFPFAPSTTC